MAKLYTISYQHNIDDAPSSGDERLSRACAEDALFEGRLKVREQGYDVEALTKPQQLHQKKSRAKLANNSPSSGGGVGEQHPELPEMDGLPPDDLVLPDSELDPNSPEGREYAEKLKNKISMNLSLSSAKAEAEKKYKEKLKQTFKHKEKVDFVPPRLTPR